MEEVPRLEGDGWRVGVEADPDRIAARGERVELLAQHAAHPGHAPIARYQMLLGMARDRPLPDLRLVVPGKALVLLVGELLPELAVETRAHARELAGPAHAARGGDADGGGGGGERPA